MRADIPLIESVSEMLREMMGDDFDAEAFRDSLDGETDAADIMNGLLASMDDDTALLEGIAIRAKALSDRSSRIKARVDSKRNVIKTILKATGERKMELPLATVSLLKGRTSVQITDAESVPTQLSKVTKSPDKTAIKKALEAGETVPGAQLVTGDETLSVRST